MPKIIEYCLVTDNYPTAFQERIIGMITDGFQPLGGVNCCVSDNFTHIWSQAMVRYEEVSK